MNNYNPVSNFQTFILSHEDELTQWDSLEPELDNNIDIIANKKNIDDKNDEIKEVDTIESMLEEIYPTKKESSLNKFFNLISKTMNISAPVQVDFNTIDNHLEHNPPSQVTRLV